MDISVIVPVYNEEGNLGLLYKELKSAMDSLERDYEIIFINDGSTDNSYTILNDIHKADRHIGVINFDKNYGMTSAVDAGFRYAKGNFILTIDADLQYRPIELIKVFQELQNNDVVICSRINRREVDGFIKMISSKIANYVRNKVLKENFPDAGCFLRGFRRDCLKDLVLYRGCQVFIPSLMKMAGFRIKEITVEIFPRKFGYSKYNIRNRLWKEFIALLVVNWMQKNRLRYNIRNRLFKGLCALYAAKWMKTNRLKYKIIEKINFEASD